MKFIDYPERIKRTWLFLFKLGSYSGCHQLSERSFRIFDMQFPICARCTGVLIGEIISIVLILEHTNINVLTSLTLLFIMFIDWFLQYLNVKESTNLRRFFSGIFGGIGLIKIYHYIYIFFKTLNIYAN